MKKLIQKYGKLFAREHETGKPVLEGIHYDGNGFAYVTDAFQLVRFPVEGEKKQTIHVKTKKEIPGEYPNVTRLLPDDFETSFSLNEGELKQAVAFMDVVKLVYKTFEKPYVTLEGSDGEVKVKREKRGDEIGLNVPVGTTGQEFKVHLNPNFLHNTLSLMKDVKEDGVEVHVSSASRPVRFRSQMLGSVETLILPIRVF